MNKHTAAALRAYKARNRVLKALGYASYDEYLASPLWKGDGSPTALTGGIRGRKLEEAGERCYACGKKCWSVHHEDYELATMLGEQMDRLYAVCEKCHEWAESLLGVLFGPTLATRRLKNRRRKNKLNEAVPRAARQGRQEKRAREMEGELNRLLRRDE